MAKNSSATLTNRTAYRYWTSILTGSMVLSGSVFGLAQEVELPKSLVPARKLEALPQLGLLDVERHSCLELENDSLPPFPVEAQLGSVSSRGYRPSAIQTERHRLVPTGFHAGETRQERDTVLVIAAENQQVLQGSGPLETESTDAQPWKEWTLTPVSDLKLNMKPEGPPPADSARAALNAAENGAHPSIVNVGTVTGWIAPNLTYQPLLFEDARLERYGYASPYFGVQPFRSGVHFAGSSLVFPLRVWFHRNECESPLAFERPGTCAPQTRELFVPALSNGWSLR
ncbi:MAG: hypothetical protein Q8M16_15635 [Pirellulaceae bacterium]|nr:hypothetical protein [Pirellulaceae bacterium]